MSEDLRYPVGQFKWDEDVTPERRHVLIGQIGEAPRQLRLAVEGLSPEQLNTPYRPGGWTVRQVVHHVPDSHLNSYLRFKWARTEDDPAIKTYHEDRWSELPDARTGPPEVSLALLDALHRRWVLLLRSLADEDYRRTFKHPEWGAVPLDKALALYAWHGRHHVAHIMRLRERERW